MKWETEGAEAEGAMSTTDLLLVEKSARDARDRGYKPTPLGIDCAVNADEKIAPRAATATMMLPLLIAIDRLPVPFLVWTWIEGKEVFFFPPADLFSFLSQLFCALNEPQINSNLGRGKSETLAGRFCPHRAGVSPC